MAKVKVYDGTQWVELAKKSDIPSLSGYATQTWVGNNYLPLSGGTLTGSLQIFSTGGSWNEGIRLHAATNYWSGIVFCDSANTGDTGTSANTWSIHNHEGVFGAFKNGSDISSVGVGFSHDGSNWLFKGGDIYVNSNGRLAYASEIPTIPSSLPANGGTATYLSQQALTNDGDMPPNGFSFGVYYGTPSGLQNDGHIMAFNWSSGGNLASYGAEIFIDTDPTYKFCIRQRNSQAEWNNWIDVITDNNLGSKITSSMVTNALGYTPPSTDHTYNFSGVQFNSGDANYCEHNCNNATENGHYYYTSNGPSTSIGASTGDGALYVQSFSGSWVAQIAQDYRNGRLFVRGKNNGSWEAWYRIAQYNEIPTNNNQLTNGAGYITSAALSGYATQSWVQQQGYLSSIETFRGDMVTGSGNYKKFGRVFVISHSNPSTAGYSGNETFLNSSFASNNETITITVSQLQVLGSESVICVHKDEIKDLDELPQIAGPDTFDFLYTSQYSASQGAIRIGDIFKVIGGTYPDRVVTQIGTTGNNIQYTLKAIVPKKTYKHTIIFRFYEHDYSYEYYSTSSSSTSVSTLRTMMANKWAPCITSGINLGIVFQGTPGGDVHILWTDNSGQVYDYSTSGYNIQSITSETITAI